MSAVRSLSALALMAALGLASCGQPADAPASDGAARPAAEPVVLTDEQKAALLAELPEPYRSADLERGERLYA
ncbi:MAG: cytochrome c family protein, partial [Phenylobacterium sp.]